MNIEKFPTMSFQKGRQIGFLAQNVEKVVPEAVNENEDGYKGVDYARLVPLLLESIKEQQKQIEVLEKGLRRWKGSNLIMCHCDALSLSKCANMLISRLANLMISRLIEHG